MLEPVDAVGVDLARGGIERDAHVHARLVARRLDPLDQRLQRGLVGLEVGREAALVARGGTEPAALQRPLERMEHLGAHAQPLGERGGAHRHDHELLEVHLVVRVRPAVQHVHHRHGQNARLLAAQVAPQRNARLGRGGPCHGERDAQDGVGSQAALVRRAVQLDHRVIEPRLVERRRGRRPHAASSPLAFATAVVTPDAVVLRPAVPQLDRLELAGGGARGHRGAAPGVRGEGHLHLHRRIAPAVEDLAGVDVLDLAQLGSDSSISALKRCGLAPQRDLRVDAQLCGGLHGGEQQLADFLVVTAASR